MIKVRWNRNKSIKQATIVWRTRNRNGVLFGIKQHYDLNIQLNVNLVQVLRDQNFRYFKIFEFSYLVRRPPWSYGSWIYNYLRNHCLSPLMLWIRISIRARCTTLCDKICQCLATGLWFSPGPPVFSTNKTDHHDITEILLKVTLNTITQTNIIFG
jgi:hypothetical protein